jgi:hypothetical protein
MKNYLPQIGALLMLAIPVNDANANINYAEKYNLRTRIETFEKEGQIKVEPIIVKANPARIYNLPLEMRIEIPQNIKPIRLRKLTDDEIRGRNTPSPPIPNNGTNK